MRSIYVCNHLYFSGDTIIILIFAVNLMWIARLFKVVGKHLFIFPTEQLHKQNQFACVVYKYAFQKTNLILKDKMMNLCQGNINN